MSTKCFLIVCCVIGLLAIYSPARHAKYYEYISADNVYAELSLLNLDNGEHNLKNCEYEKIILNSTDIDTDQICHVKSFDKPRQGGEFIPKHCQAIIKTAVIVPYRNRSDHLTVFINFMHNFLQKQNIIYRIFIVNQNDSLAFNRAKMLNYGAKVAMDMDYPCLILHDIDLIPLNTGNIYSCGKKPRHMSSSVDTFRFNLPYLSLFGGAVAIQSDHFRKINGMSNEFSGWGGEDDDFYTRVEAHDLLPYRFEPNLSKYTMLAHKKEKASPNRYTHLKYSIERHRKDGLNSLSNDISVKLEDLYTLVIAS